jgi:tight adherence protein C
VNAVAVGCVLGLLGGLGLLSVASWFEARRPARVVARIGPFVGLPGRAFARGAEPSVAPWTVVLELVRPSASAPRASGDRDLERRLARAGQAGSAGSYRLERVVWAGVGGCVGAVLGAALAAGGSSSIGVVLLGALGAAAGWGLRDSRLRHGIRRRQRVIEQQLPVLADLLALAVGAGATPVAALERSARVTGGPLGGEVDRVVADVRSGAPLEAALRSLDDRVGLPSVQRFVDGLVVAIERGTPLAEVVRAQAADARAARRRLLMEQAGRKDVAMLVPVVFLVLPIVVVIALFPGIHALHLIVP